MSEKRFVDTKDGIFDNQEGRLYKISAYEFFECETDEVVKLLNELAEENERLQEKQRVDDTEIYTTSKRPYRVIGGRRRFL